MLAHVVSIDLDTKTRVIMPILQEVVDEIATTLVMHDTSSMPGITDTPQMKPIVFQPSVRT